MRIILLITLLLVGCSTQLPPPMPMPAPMPEKSNRCDVIVKGVCQEMSASEKGGAGSRGHEETPKKPEYLMYIPPEELWPEDFKPAPKVCASPFQGNQILR